VALQVCYNHQQSKQAPRTCPQLHKSTLLQALWILPQRGTLLFTQAQHCNCDIGYCVLSLALQHLR
jgi:hypothetical protein